MKALVSPLEPKESGYRIVQVEPDGSIFPIAEPYYWVACSDDCNADTWYFNTQINQCVKIPPTVPTATENKITAVSLLQATDWTTIPDVADPTESNPYLANQAEFINYRNAVRQYAIYPVAGDINWPAVPQEVWQTVQL